MKAVKVVDASALAAIVFGEDNAETVTARLKMAHLLTPALLDYEMANICTTKLRRNAGQRDDILRLFAERDRITIDRVKVDIDYVLSLAEQTGLSAYDASYLWVARHHDAELVILDKKLEAAFLSPAGR